MFFSENVSVFEPNFSAQSKSDIYLFPSRLFFSAHVALIFDEKYCCAKRPFYHIVSFQANKKE